VINKITCTQHIRSCRFDRLVLLSYFSSL